MDYTRPETGNFGGIAFEYLNEVTVSQELAVVQPLCVIVVLCSMKKNLTHLKRLCFVRIF
jgi:hypothetical protein